MSQIVVVFSGGLDSTTLMYHLRAAGHTLTAMSIDYGQRHVAPELSAAETICRRLGIERRHVDLRVLADCFGGNALTAPEMAVPEGAYRADTISATTVPNRNMVLLSVGLALAARLGFDGVAFGAHAGQHTNYPDCQPGFAAAMDAAARECNHPALTVLAPFVTWDKAGIVRRGAELDVPFHLTWSCYNGGERHCGRCGTCLDRRTAFIQAGVPDPTAYVDT